MLAIETVQPAKTAAAALICWQSLRSISVSRWHQGRGSPQHLASVSCWKNCLHLLAGLEVGSTKNHVPTVHCRRHCRTATAMEDVTCGCRSIRLPASAAFLTAVPLTPS